MNSVFTIWYDARLWLYHKLRDEFQCLKIETLPLSISYTPIAIPGSTGLSILRRDLFDARFQLISTTDPDDAAEGGDKGLNFIDAPSDLLPGVYEGGFKTWECSVDLISYLDSNSLPGTPMDGPKTNQSVLEVYMNITEQKTEPDLLALQVGCGTALPSAYIIRKILDQPPSGSKDEALGEENILEFYLQDYNQSVLELVRLPLCFLSPHRTHKAVETRDGAGHISKYSISMV
jgi:protein-histidine N-methyltransferase